MPRAARTNHGRPRFWKTAGYMLLLGVVCPWLAILLHKSHRYPFFFGLALGLGVAFSKSTKDVVGAIGAMALLGGVFWFFGVLSGGILVGFGVPDRVASVVPLFAFGLGAILGAVLPFAVLQDRFETLTSRFKSRASDSA